MRNEEKVSKLTSKPSSALGPNPVLQQRQFNISAFHQLAIGNKGGKKREKHHIFVFKSVMQGFSCPSPLQLELDTPT